MQPDAHDAESPSADGTDVPEPLVARMEAEVEQLRHSVSSHAGIDQAVGVLLTMGRMTPDEALDTLREVSSRTGTPVDRLAELLVDYPRSGSLPAAVRRELERQVVRPRADGEHRDGDGQGRDRP
ncbi:ANTAR domain-containing protein [Streptomyces sp. NPDC088785]|uniref:ANTAR domain-containing protein n=1 Tax=Streptomyces sp. NPDC088785 TaxID=3365897 RepID=UPI0037FFBE97